MVRQMLGDAFDRLHDMSIPSIEMLQTSFPQNERLMISISTLLDPRYVFLIYAPILFALNKQIGHRFIIALTLTEWANQILKWLLAGDRPYWYVHERAAQLSHLKPIVDTRQGFGSNMTIDIDDSIYLSDGLSESETPMIVVPQLRQFPVTCELGAGSPSGHAMVTATVWYVLIDALLKSELRPNSIKLPSGITLSQISWSIYTMMLISVSISRVYLACHFPHQCVGGALLGFLVGWFVCEKIPIHRLKRSYLCLATIFMFVSVLGTYKILALFGFDALWSVQKGIRWCVDPSWLHMDTTPFSSMMRYIGFSLGSGLAFDTKHIVAKKTTTVLITAIVSILFGQILAALPIPKSNLILFYAISLVTHTIFSYSIAGTIPKIIGGLSDKVSLKN